MLSFVYTFAFEKVLLNIECLRYDSFHQMCDLKLFSLSLSIDCLNFFVFLFAVLGSNMPLHTVGKHSFPNHHLYSLLLFPSLEELKFLILAVPFINFSLMDCAFCACLEFYLHENIIGALEMGSLKMATELSG